MRYWPSAQTIANTEVEELIINAKLGYRAKNLKAIATTLTQDFPSMHEFYAMDPKEAKNKLLTLQGIGEYSAELVMPKRGFRLMFGAPKSLAPYFTVKYLKNHGRGTCPQIGSGTTMGQLERLRVCLRTKRLAPTVCKNRIDLTKF